MAWHNPPVNTDSDLGSGELEERLCFETLLADLSSRFILLPSEQVDSAILDAQRRVCKCLGLEVASLWQWTPSDPDRWTRTHAFWTRDEEVPAPVVASEVLPVGPAPRHVGQAAGIGVDA